MESWKREKDEREKDQDKKIVDLTSEVQWFKRFCDDLTGTIDDLKKCLEEKAEENEALKRELQSERENKAA